MTNPAWWRWAAKANAKYLCVSGATLSKWPCGERVWKKGVTTTSRSCKLLELSSLWTILVEVNGGYCIWCSRSFYRQSLYGFVSSAWVQSRSNRRKWVTVDIWGSTDYLVFCLLGNLVVLFGNFSLRKEGFCSPQRCFDNSKVRNELNRSNHLSACKSDTDLYGCIKSFYGP